MHEEGGDSHRSLYCSDSYEGNIYEDWDKIGVFTLEANADDIDLSDDKNSNGGGDSSDDDEKKTQTRAITMKRNLNPLDLKNFF